MSNFIESPRFPDDMAYWATGGAEFNTTIIQLNSGFEQRNINWQQSRATYSINGGMRTQDIPNDYWNLSVKNTITFFRAMKGRAFGFRFKDFQDYKISINEGVLNSGFGEGIPQYQLYKNYSLNILKDTKKITKPVINTIKVYRNNNLVTFGVNPSNCLLDTTNGIITFNPDKTLNITSIPSGINPQITYNNHGLLDNQTVYLYNLNNGNLLNNTTCKVSVIDINNFTLQVENLSNINQGEIRVYPQPGETLKFEGEFDLPCRFDNDNLDYAVSDGGLIEISNLKIVEIRV